MGQNKSETRNKMMHFYPGRDSNFNYIAIPFRNILLHGTVKATRSSLLQHMIIRTIQEQLPSNLKFLIFDADNIVSNLYISLMGDGREIAHIEKVEKVKDDDDTLTTAVKYLDDIKEVIASNTITKVVVITGVDRIVKNSLSEPGRVREFYNILKKRLTEARAHNVCFLVDFGPAEIPDDVINCFGIKMCIKTTSTTMAHSLIGSDVAVYNTDDSCYVWIQGEKGEPFRLFVPRQPEKWNKRVLKAFSNTKDEQAKNTTVETVDDVEEKAEESVGEPPIVPDIEEETPIEENTENEVQEGESAEASEE